MAKVIPLYQVVFKTHSMALRLSGEVIQQVRLGFEAHRQAPDIEAIKFHLSSGRAQLKELREMLDMMRA